MLKQPIRTLRACLKMFNVAGSLSTKKGQRTDHLRAPNWQHVNKNRRRVSACTRHRVTPHGGGKQCAIQVTACVLGGKKQRYSSKIQAFLGYLSFANCCDIGYHQTPRMNQARLVPFSHSLRSLRHPARADNKPTTDTSDCYYKVRNCIWQFLNKCIQYS